MVSIGVDGCTTLRRHLTTFCCLSQLLSTRFWLRYHVFAMLCHLYFVLVLACRRMTYHWKALVKMNNLSYHMVSQVVGLLIY